MMEIRGGASHPWHPSRVEDKLTSHHITGKSRFSPPPSRCPCETVATGVDSFLWGRGWVGGLSRWVPPWGEEVLELHVDCSQQMSPRVSGWAGMKDAYRDRGILEYGQLDWIRISYWGRKDQKKIQMVKLLWKIVWQLFNKWTIGTFKQKLVHLCSEQHHGQ